MADLLKNLIDQKFVERLIVSIAKQSTEFTATQFRRDVLNDNWNNLELKQRITCLVTALQKNLKGDYLKQLSILIQVAPEFSGLGALIFPEFISIYGLEHWQASLQALKFVTQFSSSEFAIRHFIRQDQERALETMLEWSKDKNEHVRRLASEGCRPRLPWSFKLPKLIKDPAEIFLILENLKADEALYVRKSVANNLNDITKDHPELVLKWAKQQIGKNANTDWILKHGLRTLLKQGNEAALKLFGVGDARHFSVKQLKLHAGTFKIGKELAFDCVYQVKAGKPQKVRIEYAIFYHKKSGAKSKKVFKISEKEIKPGIHRLTKKHSLRQMTTRKHYPGEHQLEIIFNGKALKKIKFELRK